MQIKYFFFISMLLFCSFSRAQKNDISVIAYYTGGNDIDSFAIEKLTHIIFSFCHLKQNKLNVANAADTAMIQRLAGLKQKYPGLKVMLSLGGWGGCASCSDVFSTATGRKEFAKSVKEINNYFKTDGIDLDWEYPAIAGYPDHKFSTDDKDNFTALVKQLRKKLGKKNEISFAAGGFKTFVETSVDWPKVMKKVNRVNLMTYDLVSGYSTVTGHHTPLYSTAQNPESVNNAVSMLQKKGVAKSKMVIGAAFYGRMWEGVADTSFGIYQQGKFKAGVSHKDFTTFLATEPDFIPYWDSTAQAPYLYNPLKKLFITYDDKKSVGLKTTYAINNDLGGIMFWELRDDAYKNGLLDAIDKAKKEYNEKDKE
jgi:chitinase